MQFYDKKGNKKGGQSVELTSHPRSRNLDNGLTKTRPTRIVRLN